MNKRLLIIISVALAAVLLVLALVLVVPMLVNRGEANNDTTTHNLVWRVPPTLPHEEVLLCCGFMNEQWQYIDPITGQLMDGFHCGHGGDGNAFVYDAALGLFGQESFGSEYSMSYGLHPVDGFEESVRVMFAQLGAQLDWMDIDETMQWFMHDATRLQVVPNVDSAQRHVSPDPLAGMQRWMLTQEARTGEVAVFDNLQRITPWLAGVRPALEWAMLAVLQHDTWTIVDFDGTPYLPTQFANFWFICEDTAFARLPNGRYGILDVTATLELDAATEDASEMTTVADETTPQPFISAGEWMFFESNFPQAFTRGQGYRFAAHYALSPTHLYVAGGWEQAGTRVALNNINQRTSLGDWETIAGITPQGLLVRVRSALYLLQADGSRTRLAQGESTNDAWWGAHEIWYNAASHSFLLVTAFSYDSWQMEALELDTMQRHVIHTSQSWLEWGSHIWSNLEDGTVTLHGWPRLHINERNQVSEWNPPERMQSVTADGWEFRIERPDWNQSHLYRQRPNGTQRTRLRDDVVEILEVNGRLFGFVRRDLEEDDSDGFVYAVDVLYRLDANGNTVGDAIWRGYATENGSDYLLCAGNFILISRFVYGGGFGSHVVALHCPATQTLFTPERG